MPADLEAICLKCLAKMPEDRYATAEALADDLRRFLTGEPVAARPLPPWQRDLPLSGRKPTLAALAGVTLLGVVLFLFLTQRHSDALGTALEQETAAKALALEKQQEAETEPRPRGAELSPRPRSGRTDRLSRRDRTAGHSRPHEVRRKILDAVQKHYQDFIDERRDDPKLEEDLAVALSQRAALLQQMGDSKQAIAALEQALARRRRCAAATRSR